MTFALREDIDQSSDRAALSIVRAPNREPIIADRACRLFSVTFSRGTPELNERLNEKLLA
jgi:hypothetical protein